MRSVRAGGVEVAAFVAACGSVGDPAAVIDPCAASIRLAPADVRSGKALPPRTCWDATGDLVVQDGTLAIGEGVTIRFAQGSRLRTSGAGRLKAIGTASNPVVLRGSDDKRGAWVGVGFESDSSDNRLENVEVIGAGASAWTGDGDTRAAVYVGRQGGAGLVNVLASKSDWYGLYLHGEDSRAEPMAGLSVTDSARIARVHAQAARQLAGDERFERNDESRVRLGTGGTDFIVRAGTWRRLAVPWLVVSKVHVRAAITVQAGASFRFTEDARITVDARDGNAGSFAAVGTPDARIEFVGDGEVPGAWAGVGFDTGSAQNKLAYATVRFGGRDAWTGNPLSKAAVFVGEKARLALETVTIASSSARGIHLYGNESVVSCAGVTFEASAGSKVGRGDSNLDACP